MLRRLCLFTIAVLLSGPTILDAETEKTSQQPVHKGMVQAVGGQLYYEECGPQSMNALVFLHDGVVDSRIWDGVFLSVCRQHHAIRYDRRGYGNSPAAISPYDEIDDLAVLLTTLNIQKATLIAASHGAQISIDFTLRHPDEVRSMILVGPLLSGLPVTQHFLDREEKTFGGNGGSLESRISAIVSDDYLTAPSHTEARQKIRDLLVSRPQDLDHADWRLPTRPALGQLQRITVPTLILVGEFDIPDVQAHAGAIEAGIVSSRRMVVPGVGHLIYLESPEVFIKLISGFLPKNDE